MNNLAMIQAFSDVVISLSQFKKTLTLKVAFTLWFVYKNAYLGSMRRRECTKRYLQHFSFRQRDSPCPHHKIPAPASTNDVFYLPPRRNKDIK